VRSRHQQPGRHLLAPADPGLAGDVLAGNARSI
jgi:hypothetical protein